MITADDIDTLLFDVLGAVVDEAGSMQAEVATALGQADDSAQAEALAAAWLRRASALVTSICEGSPCRLPVRAGPLALDPRRTLMVAAHAWDLRAAADFGLRTALIQRAGEDEPEPSDAFDLEVPDLAALAARLLA
jgi:hypothetical protein